MEDDKLQPTDQYYNPAPTYGKKRSKKRILFFIIALILLGLAAFTLFQYINSQNSTSTEETITPAPTESFIPTDTPTPMPETSTTPSPTSKTSPTPTTKSTTTTGGLDRSKLSIQILNGSGTAGAAGKAKTVLTDLGYNVVSTGNADSFDYEETEIQVRSTKKDYLSQLTKDLSGTYTIGDTSSTLSASTSADAIVIVGKK